MHVTLVQRRLKVLIYIFFLLCILCFLSIQKWKPYQRFEMEDYFNIYTLYNATEHKHSQACTNPDIDAFDPVFMKGYTHLEVPQCEKKPDLIYMKDDNIMIKEDVLNKIKNLTCQVQFIMRKSDFYNEFTEIYSLSIKNNQIPLKGDFFKVNCNVGNSSVYSNVHSCVFRQSNSKSTQGEFFNKFNVNIMVIGFDSLSQNAFKRLLPQTLNYFTKTLDGQVLNGYNIVGDGTPQALIPILTGKTELELPCVLQGNQCKSFVDEYPMIWKDFKKAGYVTAFAEDSPHMGCFTYRMNGFKQQPTDHFMRPFFMVAMDQFNKHKKFCLGEKRRIQIFLNWLIEVFEKYEDKQKFVFGFHSELSHQDNNDVQTADNDILFSLKYLKRNGILNNTVLMLISDHGARFSEIRSTLQGKQEERRPFFGIYMPENLKAHYPQAWQNLKINTKRLSTPFDIYETFKHLLNFQNFSKASVEHRGISLFDEIPKERTCYDASIEPHWCACMQWYLGNIDAQEAKDDAYAVVKHINDLTANIRDKCEELVLQKIRKFLILSPTMEMLQFKKSQDIHGRIPEFGDKTSISYILHQIEIAVMPSDAIYEVTLKYGMQPKLIEIKTKDISRINRYGNSAHCIEKEHENLRKFCFCKKI